MNQSLHEWQRGARTTFTLGHETGVYALFLREGSTLSGVEPGEYGLLYIGLAANRKGLKGRCHFNARTRNHSPRKSLAVLLMDELNLTPVLIAKPNSADTWGLNQPSDAKLSEWMQDNLDLAVEICADPDNRETELVSRYAPPLNLTKCVQTMQHRLISTARARIMAGLQGKRVMDVKASRSPEKKETKLSLGSTSAAFETLQSTANSDRVLPIIGAGYEDAESISARYGLNPKSYRQRLRDAISWYRKPQAWRFEVDSYEWRDMIAVAERMASR